MVVVFSRLFPARLRVTDCASVLPPRFGHRGPATQPVTSHLHCNFITRAGAGASPQSSQQSWPPQPLPKLPSASWMRTKRSWCVGIFAFK